MLNQQKTTVENLLITFLEKIENKNIILEDKKKNKKILELWKELKEKKRLIKEYQEYIEDISTNEEEKNTLIKEINFFYQKKEEILSDIKIEIIKEENINDSLVLEIRPGTGGSEANLFVHDLFVMYYKYVVSKKKWKLNLLETKIDKEGSFLFVSMMIKGKNAYSWLKNESGVHRVQRVPETESKGRVHTSTATVAVLAEPKEIELSIKQQDIKIETFCASGPGGQHVNKTESAIRITHLPTGITAVSQDSKDQRINRERAYTVLKSRIFEKIKEEEQKKEKELRSSMIGTGERSEKIRTYNWNQNRVTDHRIEVSFNRLNTIMEGELEDMLEMLMIYELNKNINNLLQKHV